MSMGWDSVHYPNLDPFLTRPVEVGLWKLHETFDGTYTIDDLFDIHEILDVQLENKIRARDWKERNDV